MGGKWTPGPWVISTPTQGYEVCTMHGLPPQPPEDGHRKTWVYIGSESLTRNGEWQWPDEQEQLANAHLIAAAPDLYMALEAMTARMSLYRGRHDDAMVAIGNAALAKARGEGK